MTRLRRALALLLAIALCTAAVIAWWPKARPPVASVSSPAAELALPAPAPFADTPPAATTASASAPATRRRASDTRLADIAATLQARADAGDAYAACRLGTDLLRCGRLSNYPADFADSLERREQAREAMGNLDEADTTALVLLRYLDLQRTCEGLDPRLIARGGHYLRQAALAGQPDAVIRYAKGDAFNNGHDFRFITHPEFDQWRQEAPGLMQQSLTAGDPGAVLLMLHAHAGHGLLGMLTPADALEAQSAAALARRVFGDQIDLGYFGMPAGQDAGPSEAAEARAAELHARHFGGETHDFARAAYSFVPLHDMNGVSEWPIRGASMKAGNACRPAELR